MADQTKTSLLAQGEEAVLLSEIPSHVPRLEDEDDKTYSIRCHKAEEGTKARGMHVIHDGICGPEEGGPPNGFHVGTTWFVLPTREGRIMKGEYRDFCKWYYEVGCMVENDAVPRVPERFERWKWSGEDGE